MTDVALGKALVTWPIQSGTLSGSGSPFDGNDGTWKNVHGAGVTGARVDLGGYYTVTSVRVKQGSYSGDAAQNYDVYYYDDLLGWQVAKNFAPGNTGGSDDSYSFASPITSRWWGLQKNTGAGDFLVWTWELNGAAATNVRVDLALSSHQNVSWANSDDGDPDTWMNLQNGTALYDFGSAKSVSRVAVHQGSYSGDYASPFIVASSPDNATWTTRATFTPGGPSVGYVDFTAVTAQYWSLRRSGGPNTDFLVWEFSLYAPLPPSGNPIVVVVA